MRTFFCSNEDAGQENRIIPGSLKWCDMDMDCVVNGMFLFLAGLRLSKTASSNSPCSCTNIKPNRSALPTTSENMIVKRVTWVGHTTRRAEAKGGWVQPLRTRVVDRKRAGLLPFSQHRSLNEKTQRHPPCSSETAAGTTNL